MSEDLNNAAPISLKVKEKTLQEIVKSVPDNAVQLDRNLHVMWANSSILEAIPDIIGRRCYEAILGSPERCQGCPCQRAFKSGLMERDIIYNEQDDSILGRESYWDTICIPLKDDEDRVGSVMTIGHNVTEIKRSEKRLECINRCLLSLGPDFDDNVNKITSLCGELFGADCALYNRLQSGLLCSLGQWHTPEDYNPEDQPDGHICYDVIQGKSDDFVIIEHLDQTTYAKTDPNVIAYNLKTYVGKLIHCKSEPVGALCVVFQSDFTPSEEDKRILGILASALSAEEYRRKTDEELRQANDYLEMVLFGGDLGAWDLNIQTGELRLNDQCAWMIGYECDAIEPTLAAWVALIHPDDLPTARERWNQYLKDESSFYEAEYRMRCKNGDWIWILDRGKVISREKNGTPLRACGTHLDITERKNIERVLKEARNAAEAANRAKSVFLANMSHELRSPLNPIMGFTDLVLSGTLTDKQREHLHIVKRRSKDLLKLLDDILDLAQIEADHMTLNPELADVRMLVDDIMLLYDQALSEKDICLHVSVVDNVPKEVYIDTLRLRQILINLLGNAVKFTEEGSVTLTVKRDISKPDDHMACTLKFIIQDTGIGISPYEQEKIFNAFEQVETSYCRQYGGVGLGLAICKRLVGLMGGEIGLESRMGEGATFHFSIKAALTNPECKKNSQVVPDNMSSHRSLNILLVEDDSDSRQLVEQMLKKEQHQYESVINGLQAVEACCKKQYDMVLMDVKMPVMDGLEATRKIREFEQQQNRHTPIIALTAFAFNEDQDACLDAGMDAYIVKPVNASLFNQTINEILAS